MRALRVAIPGAEFCPSLVAPTKAAALLHLREVHGAVQAARKLRDVDVKAELPILQLEQLVRMLGVREVQPRADIWAGDKTQLKAPWDRPNAVGAGVLAGRNTLQSAMLRASLRVRAELLIPRRACVAIAATEALLLSALAAALHAVHPTPIRIQGCIGMLHLATPLLRASCHKHSGWCFDLGCARQLRTAMLQGAATQKQDQSREERRNAH
mmetsp:Transcript_30016/g.75726  ORF Transcript_30016/g.75726 Transcript_30016/m.75726 type:complete len:212 (-) Transcript_30016:76-711(-)